MQAAAKTCMRFSAWRPMPRRQSNLHEAYQTAVRLNRDGPEGA